MKTSSVREFRQRCSGRICVQRGDRLHWCSLDVQSPQRCCLLSHIQSQCCKIKGASLDFLVKLFIISHALFLLRLPPNNPPTPFPGHAHFVKPPHYVLSDGQKKRPSLLAISAEQAFCAPLLCFSEHDTTMDLFPTTQPSCMCATSPRMMGSGWMTFPCGGIFSSNL